MHASALTFSDATARQARWKRGTLGERTGAPAFSLLMILVVDDNPDIRAVISELLEDEGYRTQSAADGQLALAILRDEPAIRLILLDLMMPVMDGRTFLEKQQRDPRLAGIAVAIFTAGTPFDVVPPVVTVLRKPISANQLLEVVRQYCGR